MIMTVISARKYFFWLKAQYQFCIVTLRQQNFLKHHDVLFIPRGQLSVKVQYPSKVWLPCIRFGQSCFIKISQNETNSSNKLRQVDVCPGTLRRQEMNWAETDTQPHQSLFLFTLPLQRFILAGGAEGSRYSQAFKKCFSFNLNALSRKKNPDGLYTGSVCRKSSTYSITFIYRT